MPNLAAVLSNFCGACFIIFQCFIGKKKMSREENVVEINCCNSFCFQREFALVPATPNFFQKKKKKESVITVLFYTFSSFFCLYFWVFFGFAVINCTTIVQLSAFLDVFFPFWWFATLNYRDTSNSREYVSKQSRTCFKETSTHFKISTFFFQHISFRLVLQTKVLKTHMKTPFAFWDMRASDMWKVCLQKFRKQ